MCFVDRTRGWVAGSDGGPAHHQRPQDLARAALSRARGGAGQVTPARLDAPGSRPSCVELVDEGREAAALVEPPRRLVAVHVAHQQVVHAEPPELFHGRVEQQAADPGVALAGHDDQRLDLRQALAGGVGLVSLCDVHEGVADGPPVAAGQQDERILVGEPAFVLPPAPLPRLAGGTLRQHRPHLGVPDEQRLPQRSQLVQTRRVDVLDGHRGRRAHACSGPGRAARSGRARPPRPRPRAAGTPTAGPRASRRRSGSPAGSRGSCTGAPRPCCRCPRRSLRPRRPCARARRPWRP